jgi:sulfite exporter TauE/SafE/copper chaperone CopZ
MIQESSKSKIIKKKYFKVRGMTCHNCETKIIEILNKIPEITKSKADYVSGIVVIEYEESELLSERVSSLIQKEGYENKEISRIQKIANEFLPLFIASVIIITLYFIAETTGFLNRIPEIRENMSYPILFIVGVMTSVHCIGMCGGINLSQTSSKSIEETKFPVFKRGLQYNLGRLISYTILGGIVGGIGSIFSLSLTLQGIIIFAAGVIMVIMGLNMVGLFSILKRFVPVMPASIGIKIFKLSGKRNPFIIGLLNGFMPCGPLQAMQIYALSTGSILKGALSMFLFSAGTIPLMLGFGTLSALFSKNFQKNILKLSALMIILLGGGMISRGLSLNGISVAQQNEGEIIANAAIAEIQGEIQIVSSDVSPSGYEPIVVQAGIPVQWSLEAGAGDLTGCNNAILVRKFGIQQSLKEGKTLVEFTPEESGNYPFSCWMGMINSNILVVDDLEAFDPELLNTPPESSREQIELQIPDFGLENIVFSSVLEESQVAELRIDEKGFTHSIIVMQKDLPTQWTFIPSGINEKNSRIVFPAFKSQLDMEESVNRTVDIVPTTDFYFYTWKGDYVGFVIVVDDISISDKENVLSTVNSYLK